LRNNKDWSRPIYYAATVGHDMYLNMKDYFRQEGIAYRIVPYNTKKADNTVDTEIMFDNMMNKYRWGNVADPKIYLDENALRMCKTFRTMFGSLVEALINEGKTEKAEQALDYCVKVLPPTTVKYDYSALSLAAGYLAIDKIEKSLDIYTQIADRSMGSLNWYFRLKPNDFRSVFSSVEQDLYIMREVLSALQEIDPQLVDKYIDEFNTYFSQYMSIMQLQRQQKQSLQENN